MMNKIALPHTSLEGTRLILGCMGLGGGWEKSTALTKEHLKQARDFVDTALELGANFFDHANIYAHGRAEKIFGQVLAERPGLRERIILQSKVGIRWADEAQGQPQRFDFSRQHILEAVDAILSRLGTEYLDVLLLHRPDALWRPEEVAEAFGLLKAQGKVRYFGVSNQNRFQMEYLQSVLPDPLVANQVQMSLMHSGFAEVGISFNQNVPQYPNGWEGTMEYCRMNQVALQAWSPLDRGVLPPEVAQVVKMIADRHETTVETVQLAWLLKHPAGIQPVLGTSRPDRLRNCARALDVEISREEWYTLFAAARGKPMP